VRKRRPKGVKVMTLNAAAKMLGLSPDTVRRIIMEQKVIIEPPTSGPIRIPRKAVERFLRERALKG